MKRKSFIAQGEVRWLAAIIGFCLFSWPIFSTSEPGIGLLYGSFFIFWIAIIVLLWAIVLPSEDK